MYTYKRINSILLKKDSKKYGYKQDFHSCTLWYLRGEVKTESQSTF